MATTAIDTTPNGSRDMSMQAMENVLVNGDLSRLSPQERLSYYRHVCQSVGLNPLTRPFDYLKLSGRLVLYARKDATDQLRKIHNVSIEITDRERLDDVYVVTAVARMPDGRVDSEIGAVNVQGLKGESLANALMKATTKAKRRVTLSICGMGMLDETETETIPHQQRQFVEVDHETGEIKDDTPSVPAAANGSGRMPDAWVEKLRELADKAGITGEELNSHVKEQYGVGGYAYLSTVQAQQVAAYMKAKAKANEDAPAESPDIITDQQMKKLHAAGKDVGYTHDELNALANERYGKPVKELTKAEASDMIDMVQQ